MPDIRIASSEGGAFDCHIAPPKSGTGPALIVMSSIFGVDADVRGIAADLAGRGIFVAAPDLFWRGDSGPKDRSEEGVRTANARAADRVPMIEGGLRDLVDVMTALRAMPECNGRFASVGLCFGGPFALLGPARAGGWSAHGSAHALRRGLPPAGRPAPAS